MTICRYQIQITKPNTNYFKSSIVVSDDAKKAIRSQMHYLFGFTPEAMRFEKSEYDSYMKTTFDGYVFKAWW